MILLHPYYRYLLCFIEYINKREKKKCQISLVLYDRIGLSTNKKLPVPLFDIAVSFTVEFIVVFNVVEDDAMLVVVVLVVCSKSYKHL